LGKVEPVRVYEIMAPAGALSPVQQELRDLYAEGVAAYRACNWERAKQHFAQCLAAAPNDRPAAVFRRRIECLSSQTLPTDWNGVWQLTDK
jgi:adenylate cyclase